MSIILGLFKFIFSVLAIFFTWILIMNIVSSIINPQIVIEEGKVIEKNNNARIWFAIIVAISWAFVIIIP